MDKGLLVKYGEIAIRGKNRYLFERQLLHAIKRNIKCLGNYYIEKEQGRFFIYNLDGETDVDALIEKVSKVLGVVAVCPSLVTDDHSIENIKAKALEYFNKYYPDDGKKKSFKVQCRRSNKKYPLTSYEISCTVGEYLLENVDNLYVDVHNPDIVINVELRTKAYIFSKVIKCFGGLPIGSSGKGMLLLSGGIDSPVAGFMMEKRGVELEAVYFHSPPYTSERAKEKVMDLAARLADYSGGIKLHVIPFTEIQLHIYESVPPEKMTIILKRTMLKIADKIAEDVGALALIVGDSVGQVASQTMRSIQAVESASKLPILRPLAGFDKQEIIDIAVKIDTYDISIRPYEDCCTIFTAKHPETKPKVNIIENIERNIKGLDEMITEAIKASEIIDI